MTNFSPSSKSSVIAHQDIPFDLRHDVQVLADDGAITLKSGQVHLTKGSAAAITIALPDHDGQELTIITETAYAHVVTQATDGFNAKGSSGTLTFTAAAGNAVVIVSRNGHWWTKSLLNVAVG
jgi:hypothetical protein